MSSAEVLMLAAVAAVACSEVSVAPEEVSGLGVSRVQYIVCPWKQRLTSVCEAVVKMPPWMLMLYQSSDTERAGIKVGVRTRPKVVVTAFSGVNAGLPPDVFWIW